jgi:baculoviral IAP repeat-containing protein 6
LDESDDEGLALLIPDIQETASLVQNATYSDVNMRDELSQSFSGVEYSLSTSIEQKYLEVMKKLQFGKLTKIFCKGVENSISYFHFLQTLST